jgi:5-methylcytosine-specific restriction endonuclease McrA
MLHAILTAVMSANVLNEPVLLLNINFEPLNVCSTRRALILLVSGKADLVLNGRGVIRSSSREFELPSIIKLTYMVGRPRPRVALSKREVLRRDEYTCQYCGRHSALLTLDHVVPRHLGGEHSWLNLVAACAGCNRQKGGRTPEQAHMSLRRPPYEPSSSAHYRFGRHLSQREEWEPFLSGW